MLQMPRRSVTRFFIPLIDVLTLLFCVFLVMPLAKSSDQDAASNSAEDLKKLRAELDRLHGLGADEPEKLRKELDELRKAKSDLLVDQLFVQVLEIDDKTGELSYRSDNGPTAIKTDNELLRLRDKLQQRAGAKRVVSFQILYPADPKSRRPTTEQRRIIEGWFVTNAIPYKFMVPTATEKEP